MATDIDNSHIENKALNTSLDEETTGIQYGTIYQNIQYNIENFTIFRVRLTKRPQANQYELKNKIFCHGAYSCNERNQPDSNT